MKSRVNHRRQTPTTPTIQAAIDYVLLDLRVIPLRDRSKMPRQRGWSEKAVADVRAIPEWPRTWHNSNLGIATDSRLIALDVDAGPGKDGLESLDRLLDEYGPLPITATARTGSGGYHYLFRASGRRRVGTRVGWRPGLDIKAEGGYIVVAPSVHPITGKEYAWIRHPRYVIAEIPRWLLTLLTPAKPEPRIRRDPSRRLSLSGRRVGDAGRLLAEMIAKFPIPGFGHRRDLMARAVASLIGRNYGDVQITEVLMKWWEHHHRQGKTRTGRAEAGRELAACIASTRRNPAFEPARSSAWHQDLCRRIRLDARQKRLLQAPIPGDESGIPSLAPAKTTKNSPAPPHGERVTRIGGRLCNSDDEKAFVEALIVHVTHKRIDIHDEMIRMTDDQVRQIAAERRGPSWRGWNHEQMARLKRKYVSTPSAEASRFELLRLLNRGRPGAAPGRGIPSEYEATGIEELLTQDAKRRDGRLRYA